MIMPVGINGHHMWQLSLKWFIQERKKTIKHVEQNVNRWIWVKGRQQGIVCTVLATCSVSLKLFLSKRLKEKKRSTELKLQVQFRTAQSAVFRFRLFPPLWQLRYHSITNVLLDSQTCPNVLLEQCPENKTGNRPESFWEGKRNHPF